MFHIEANSSSNHVNNVLTNNIRAPQTPTVNNNSSSEGTITVHHQSGPVTLPIDEPLPSGYV